MLLGLYNFLWKCAIPFIKKNKRFQHDFIERLAKKLPSPTDIWIQSASAGEAFLVKEVLQFIPDTKASYLLTTWTPEGRKILEGIVEWAKIERPDWNIQISYFPLDIQEILEKFLSSVQPKLVILVETELWPNLLVKCKEKSIPVCIINGRISLKTYKSYLLIKHILRPYAPKNILAISTEDAERFSSIFPNSEVTVMDNIKFNSLKKIENTERKYTEGSVILFASIRKKEFSLIAKTIQILEKEHRVDMYMIVPRHPHHRIYLEKALSKLGLQYTICSSLPKNTSRLRGIVIWDIFGTLKSLYNEASVVFVGGTLFKEYGGQNFLEPLIYGIVPIIGEYIDNFLWAEKGLAEKKLLYTIYNTTAITLADALKKACMNPVDRIKVQNNFVEWFVSKQSGISEVTCLLNTYKVNRE